MCTQYNFSYSTYKGESFRRISDVSVQIKKRQAIEVGMNGEAELAITKKRGEGGRKKQCMSMTYHI